MIPEMGITKNLPILLNDVTPSIESEGSFDSEVRIVMFTFNFTIKGFIFGAIKSDKIIKEVNFDINIGDSLSVQSGGFGGCASDGTKSYTMLNANTGSYIIGEIVYQGFNLECAVGTGIVKSWDDNKKELVITNISGCFDINQTVIGTKSLVSYMIQKSTSNSITVMKLVTTPDPITANSNSYWSSNTSIYEYPNIP